MFRWLDAALDIGITEHDFWNMTLAEFDRLVSSRKRVQERDAKEKATMDYILGDLIGRSIARIYNSSATYPEIYEVYPSIFEKELIEQAKFEKRMELSALNFEQFAESFNKSFAEREGKDNK